MNTEKKHIRVEGQLSLIDNIFHHYSLGKVRSDPIFLLFINPILLKTFRGI